MNRMSKKTHMITSIHEKVNSYLFTIKTLNQLRTEKKYLNMIKENKEFTANIILNNDRLKTFL